MGNNLAAEEGTGRNDDTGPKGTSLPARNDSNRRLLRSEELGEQLLPGLPNEITLDLITPKLLWKDIVSTMSSVSRAWLCVIRNHEVYDARVRSHSTEEFVITNRYLSRRGPDITLLYPSDHSIALYFPRGKYCCYQPPIPHLRTGFRSYCQCVSFHGEIYILGGEDEDHIGTRMGFDVGTRQVYVLDLYGKTEWKECASMECTRQKFGCCIFNGKIYVFGGLHIDESLRDSEMYDPEVDTWFPTKDLPSFRSRHQVATVGEDLFVYGGDYYEEIEEERRDGTPRLASGNILGEACFLEIYNPDMDEWSWIDPFPRETQEQVVLARGQLHSISQFEINVYDMDEDSWTLLHICSFPTIGLPDDSVRIIPLGAVAVGDELLLRVHFYNTSAPGPSSCLLQSRGFGSENKMIVWENAEGFPPFRDLSSHFADFMSLAEL